MPTPIYDMHCDLLSYLEHDSKRTADDPDSKCSIPQLKEGGVVYQTLAIYNETVKGSAACGAHQFSLFLKLLKNRSKELFSLNQKIKPITVAVAIENASGLLEEDEKLDIGLKRLEKMQREAGIILYISLTWNMENRFGGGNASNNVGLKKDGEELLNFMNGNKIAIDFSHTSDKLANDILNYIDKKNLKVQPIASHSNFREVTNVPRNLPDEIASEIIRRKGVIGLNFVRPFIGNDPSDFLKQIEHAVQLGGQNALCFGADFFTENDSPPELEHLKPFFFPGFDNASCYPHALTLFRKQFSEELLQRIAFKNLEAFLSSIL